MPKINSSAAAPVIFSSFDNCKKMYITFVRIAHIVQIIILTRIRKIINVTMQIECSTQKDGRKKTKMYTKDG